VHAAADERGEFLLGVTGPRRAPTGTFDVQLTIAADPAAGPVPDAAHRFDSLPLEPIPRSPDPPHDGDLDNALLRGERLPAGFAAGQTSHPVRLSVGRVHTEPQPLEFDPQ
jgi:hypothetical protein